MKLLVNKLYIKQMDIQDIYNAISIEFDHTRHSVWCGVAAFIDALPKQSLLADVGIGNAKNALYAHRTGQHTIYGCDITENFVDMANRKFADNLINGSVIIADGRSLPWKNDTMDAVMAVAVIHHLKTIKDRRAFINELLRIAKPNGGKILVTAWAAEQPIKHKWKKLDQDHNDYMIPWRDKGDRFYHLFSKSEMQGLMDGLCDCKWRLDYERDNWFLQIQL